MITCAMRARSAPPLKDVPRKVARDLRARLVNEAGMRLLAITSSFKCGNRLAGKLLYLNIAFRLTCWEPGRKINP